VVLVVLEKPSKGWSDVVDYDELMRRVGAVVYDRIGQQPLEVRERIAASTVREPRCDPFTDPMRLWVCLDGDDTVELGVVWKATFRREPPSPS
jgi:hypothetical protein